MLRLLKKEANRQSPGFDPLISSAGLSTRIIPSSFTLPFTILLQEQNSGTEAGLILRGQTFQIAIDFALCNQLNGVGEL